MAHYIVDADKSFNKLMEDASKEVGDLTRPLKSITGRWYRANKSLFTLSGPGKYEDLSDNYWPRKQKKFGFIYPILRASGRLEKSVTDPKDINAINFIVNKNSLFLGVNRSSIKYAAVHQFGHGFIPARPYLLLGIEQVATNAQKKARTIYGNILRDYVFDTVNKKI